MDNRGKTGRNKRENKKRARAKKTVAQKIDTVQTVDNVWKCFGHFEKSSRPHGHLNTLSKTKCKSSNIENNRPCMLQMFESLESQSNYRQHFNL